MTNPRHPQADAPAPREHGAHSEVAGARWLVLCVALLAFGLYLWRIEAKAIWWDESLSLYRAQKSVRYILSNRIDFPGASTIDLHPPLYFLLLHGITRLAGESDLVLRWLSVAFATLLVPLLYALGRRLRGARAGLWAALFGALSPYYLWYAQEARMYTMATALGLASVYWLWRALAEHRWSWGGAAGVLVTAAVGTQYLSALLLPLEALLVLLMGPGGGIRRVGRIADDTLHRRGRLFLGSAVIILALGLLGYWAVRLALAPKAGRGYVPLVVIVRDVFNSYSLGLSVHPPEVWLLALFFWVVFGVGIVSAWARPPHSAHAIVASHRRWAGMAVLLGYILLPVVAMWLASLFVPVYMNSRYLLIFSPAFYLGLGVGLDAIARWHRRVAWIVGVVLIVGMGFSIGRYFNHELYRTKEDYRSAARFIVARERVGDVIVVDAPENLTAFVHYYRGEMPVVGMPSVALSGDPGAERIAEEMEALARAYDRLWLVHCRTMFSDPKDRVSAWLNDHTMLLWREVFPSYGSDVTLSAHLARSPLEPRTLDAGVFLGSFAGALALSDCTVRYVDAGGVLRQAAARAVAGQASVTQLATIPAGRPLALSLSWQPQRELGDYKTSLRLVDRRGVVWAQEDVAPYALWPTTQWPLHAQVRQETNIRVPPGMPPGVYRLQVWVYEAAGGRALPFRESGASGDAPCAELGEVSVVPMARAVDVRSDVPETLPRPRWASVFGEQLELVAYGVAPDQLKPGDTLGLDLYWRARQTLGCTYELVVNWQDAGGRVWHSTAVSPTGMDYPTSHWRAGELVRGLLRLPVPAGAPHGKHSVHLLVREVPSQRLLWLRQGLVPWTGHDFTLAHVAIE